MNVLYPFYTRARSYPFVLRSRNFRKRVEVGLKRAYLAKRWLELQLVYIPLLGRLRNRPKPELQRALAHSR